MLIFRKNAILENMHKNNDNSNIFKGNMAGEADID